MFGAKMPATGRGDPGFLSCSSVALKAPNRVVCGHQETCFRTRVLSLEGSSQAAGYSLSLRDKPQTLGEHPLGAPEGQPASAVVSAEHKGRSS